MVYLAFHKGRKFPKRGWFMSFLTKLFTKQGDYSHVELVFPGWSYKKNCFSSRGFVSRNTGTTGVSMQHIRFSHPGRWVFVKLLNCVWNGIPRRIDDSITKQLYIKCCRYEGNKYDYFGVINQFVLNNEERDNKRYWCSEIITKVLGYLPSNISPQQLYDNLITINKLSSPDEALKELGYYIK